MAPELRKRTKSQTALVEKAAVVKKTKATPKRQAAEEASPVSVKKQKTVKKVEKIEEVKPTPAEEPKPRATKASKKKAAKAEPEPEPETMEVDEEEVVEEADESIIPVADISESEDGDDDEIDADIQALAAGLDPEDNDGSTPNGAEFKAGQDVGKIPQRLSKKEKKALAAKRNTVKEEPGVIYVGRLPHGFYESELRGYFGQFGTVSRLRLSRNKKTGKSKHFAFIEFSEESTAHIAAKTMDKYLLFGHILAVKFVSSEQLNANLWKGANKRFKQIPWNKIAGKKLARPLTEEAWEEKNVKETKRRADRADKLKAIGYEFEAPALKQAPAPEVVEAVEETKTEAAAEEAPAVEEAPAAEETPVVEEVVAVETVVEEVVEETPKTKKGKAGKKGKKAKA